VKKAFTLIEILVAIVLIALLIGVAVFSFRLQLITIYKVKTEGLKEVIKYTQLKDTLASIKYYVVDDYDMLNQPMKNLHYFFNGTEKTMIFISENPIFSESDALVKLLCNQDKLIYQEEPLFYRMNFLQPQLFSDSKKYVIYNNLTKCSFSYIDLHNEEYKTIDNFIPKAILLDLYQNKNDISLYCSIQSDDNRTKARIENAMYPTE